MLLYFHFCLFPAQWISYGTSLYRPVFGDTSLLFLEQISYQKVDYYYDLSPNLKQEKFQHAYN